MRERKMRITKKDLNTLKSSKELTKGWIHMRFDDYGRLDIWADINISHEEREMDLDISILLDEGILSKDKYEKIRIMHFHQQGRRN